MNTLQCFGGIKYHRASPDTQSRLAGRSELGNRLGSLLLKGPIARYLIIGFTAICSTWGSSRGFQAIVRLRVQQLHLPAGRRANKSGGGDRAGEGAGGRIAQANPREDRGASPRQQVRRPAATRWRPPLRWKHPN